MSAEHRAMKRARRLLRKLMERHGGELWRNGDWVYLRLPSGVMTPELLREIARDGGPIHRLLPPPQ